MSDEINPPVGNCPVQSEGHIEGHPYYFRARGTHWSFDVAEPGNSAISGNSVYSKAGLVEGNDYAAGWLPVDEATKIIADCVAEFKAGVRGHVWCLCEECQFAKSLTPEQRLDFYMWKCTEATFRPNPLMGFLKKKPK